MYQIIEQTAEEKFKMYNKLSKKELIMMLIEANKHLDRFINPSIYLFKGAEKPLTWKNEGFYPNQTYTTFGDLCSCNPKNGGSGLCGCTMANQEVKI